MLIDSHCHLHDAKFDTDRPDAIARARAAGVGCILTLGDTLEASRAAMALAAAEPMVLAAAGVHPCNAEWWSDDVAVELEALLATGGVAVLGEIGIDYYWVKEQPARDHQRRAFREQLAMARRLGYAVSIHARESLDHVLEDLEAERASEIGGVLHCFNGDWNQARRGLDMGMAIGVGGTSTYPKSIELRDVIRRVGIGSIVLETDAPYLAPQKQRGKRNEPAFVAHVAAAMGELFGLPVEEVARVTSDNARRALKLPA